MAPQASQEANTNVNPSSQVAALNTPSQFVNKVSSLPIVNSAFDVAKHLYDGTKERYQVVEKMEGLFVDNVVPQIVNVTHKATEATPAIVTLGLTQLDSFACNSLDLLEQRVPLIKEHPSQIVHTVSDKVTERVLALDHLVEKALAYSEEQIDYILPEQAPTSATVPVDSSSSSSSSSASRQQQLHPQQKQMGSISRAQHLGMNISKRLTQKAQQQINIQKHLTADVIHFAAALVEKQLGRLKVNFDAVLNIIHEEDVHLRKLFENYSLELRASFALALEKIEKMTHGTVTETTLSVLDGLSKSISSFVTKTGQTLHQLSESTNDPILKKCLEGAFLTLNYIQEYSLYLAKFSPIQPKLNGHHKAEPRTNEVAPETSSS
jgi:hypothetical protein